jgi:hypothetical protein
VTRTFRAVLVALSLAALAAACGGGTAIDSKALGTIMPSSADAPAGTTLAAAESGPKTLNEFVSEQAVRSRLKKLGFAVAYQATFLTPAFPDDPSKAPPGAALYGAFAVLLRDDETALEGLDFYRKRVQARSKNPTPVGARELGNDAFAFRFSSLEDAPLPGVVYFWRVGNGLFSVVGVGNPDPAPDAVRRLATTIDRRARDAA